MEHTVHALQVTLADFEAARAAVRPSALREVALELPRVRWSDVGGLEDVKASLQEAVQWPLQHAASFARLGAKVRRARWQCWIYLQSL